MSENTLRLRSKAAISVHHECGLIEVFDCNNQPEGAFYIGGVFSVEVFDPEGKLKAKLNYVKNGVTSAALDHVLNVILRGIAAQSTWYVGLIASDSYTAFNSSDTMASHAGWIEFTNYTLGTRPQWSPDAPSSNSVSNSVSVDFVITGLSATKTLQGIFLTSNSTKGGNTGSTNFAAGLFATALFTGGVTINVNNGDTVRVTYTVSTQSG